VNRGSFEFEPWSRRLEPTSRPETERALRRRAPLLVARLKARHAVMYDPEAHEAKLRKEVAQLFGLAEIDLRTLRSTHPGYMCRCTHKVGQITLPHERRHCKKRKEAAREAGTGRC